MAGGQVVIIAARWILVAAGLMLALWAPAGLVDLQIRIVLILGLAVGNFFLHSQVLRKRPTLTPVAYAASAADLLVITVLVATAGGFDSQMYVFYFPAILAISVAFRPAASMAFAAVAVGTYGIICAATLDGGAAEVVITRLVMMAAVAVCGNMYWRIERDRRRGAHELRTRTTVATSEEAPSA